MWVISESLYRTVEPWYREKYSAKHSDTVYVLVRDYTLRCFLSVRAHICPGRWSEDHLRNKTTITIQRPLAKTGQSCRVLQMGGKRWRSLSSWTIVSCLQGGEHLFGDKLCGEHLGSSANALDSDRYSRVSTSERSETGF